MTGRSVVIQEAFLKSVQEDEVSLTIFLVNGVKLTGVVASFDTDCVLLTRDGHSQLVYKHAISTIMPEQKFRMDEDVGSKMT